MVRTIKLDGVNNYFINASTNNIMLNKEFDPNNKNMDLIIKLGDNDIDSLAEFRYELYKHKVGEEVSITYIRNGKTKETKIKLARAN